MIPGQSSEWPAENDNLNGVIDKEDSELKKDSNISTGITGPQPFNRFRRRCRGCISIDALIMI